MKQRIFSHFQDYLFQYISHQYQDLLYCNSCQYILSTYNSQYNNNNNNVALAMTMPYSGRALCLQPWSLYWQSLLTQHYYINVVSSTPPLSVIWNIVESGIKHLILNRMNPW